MNIKDFLKYYHSYKPLQEIVEAINAKDKHLQLKSLLGSSKAVISKAVQDLSPAISLFILPDKESAAYFLNDLEQLSGETGKNLPQKKVLFYPTAYKRAYEIEKVDSNNILHRTEVLKRISSSSKNLMIVSFPEALTEKVVSKSFLSKSIMRLKVGEEISQDFLYDLLSEYEFEQVDFVVEPGQFSFRGGIVDVFSFSNDFPYRIEFFDEEVESIRSFDPTSQRSVEQHNRIQILPNIQDRTIVEKRQNLLSFLPQNTRIWSLDFDFVRQRISEEFSKAKVLYNQMEDGVKHLSPDELFITGDNFVDELNRHITIEMGNRSFFSDAKEFPFDFSLQPSFNKNFELLVKNLEDNSAAMIRTFILSDNPKQIERIGSIFEDMTPEEAIKVQWEPLGISLHEGFIDQNLRLACYTDHQIFERYHRFKLKERFSNKEAITLKELYNLQPGDYVTHVDYGIGRFGGLEKINNNGKEQESIRLHYKNDDLLYVSIHSLHRIAKYVGKDGTEPKLSKLGSKAWVKLKQKTKSRVKDIAKELIELYAKRKASKGYRYEPDTFMQTELEASFFFEDTPDQTKATIDFKKDMESDSPMDRLICGDVGFGKTEIAIRAAFKAVADNKQVAVLVPTTILALQHYNTFKERLKNFPATVDYINRFKSPKQQKETLAKLAAGKIDILIGTHRIVSKDVQFKDLGLLIIDEEQKFGVAIKEKLKNVKVNVDTLTLTATPIPRTLQFSLMGARDMSIINTPPPNRYPVQTELHSINEDIIRDAINYELSRRGQVYVINNRIQNIYEIADMIERLVPQARVVVGHGQMDGSKLEKTMMDFIAGEYDVLVATTIVESGLDIPNANTMIIYDAQNYGLSDLHQLRGRVGRTNKKAFCYLLAPPLAALSNEARKRLKAIEEFSELGSGFNIAMRDLDIRGAGNILGGEQSGFISEIGFEMFHQVMDEAIQELKENEFKELFKEEIKNKSWVKETRIESDLELLIPNEYVFQTAERLVLYKTLDACKTEEDIQSFVQDIEDRFGKMPKAVLSLIDTIRLRWYAQDLGFEKLTLKNNIFIGWLVLNQQSGYYSSPIFSEIIGYLQAHPHFAQMKEKNGKLSLNFGKTTSVKDALDKLSRLHKHINKQ
ncbi:MAG: transcription-repair coupling factor [Bacteroidetes bacterium]|nr:MAG: transcription-repair coupling factor [Bacteroidota bacterium]